MLKKHAPPTLEDVATLADVSTATVSRCLNSPEQAAEYTRTRVMDAVKKLGYTPNFGARAMAARRTFTIGAIIPTMENAIFARGLQAFQEELHRRGYTLLASSSAYRPDLESEQIKTLISRGADGLLLIGHERDDAIYQLLEQQGVPVIAAWAYDPKSHLPSVGFDNRAAMFLLVKEVLKLGHRDIGVISGYQSGNDRARQRVNGLMDALYTVGIAPETIKIIETTYGVESGAAAFDTLIASTRRPTAIICGNDVLAVGALKRALEIGLNVPDDISITGFDDIELARIVSPALTTVHVPHREMGREAARRLVDMVEKKSSGESTELEVSIQIRGSLGPAKQ